MSWRQLLMLLSLRAFTVGISSIISPCDFISMTVSLLGTSIDRSIIFLSQPGWWGICVEGRIRIEELAAFQTAFPEKWIKGDFPPPSGFYLLLYWFQSDLAYFLTWSFAGLFRFNPILFGFQRVILMDRWTDRKRPNLLCRFSFQHYVGLERISGSVE